MHDHDPVSYLPPQQHLHIKNSDIWETPTINSDCVWAQSINALITESISAHPAVVLRSVGLEHGPSAQMLEQRDPRCCAGDRSLWEQWSLISCCLASPLSSIYASCVQTLALNQDGLEETSGTGQRKPGWWETAVGGKQNTGNTGVQSRKWQQDTRK